MLVSIQNMMLFFSPCKRCPCPCSDAVLRSCEEALAGIILHRPPSLWIAWVRSGCAGPVRAGVQGRAGRGGGGYHGGGGGPGTREHIYIYIYTHLNTCVCMYVYIYILVSEPYMESCYYLFLLVAAPGLSRFRFRDKTCCWLDWESVKILFF